MANFGNLSLSDSQRRLVEDNIGLVYAQAKKRGITDEDLIQEGMIGLINAARYYSPDFGVKFSTYAGSYIWAAFFGTYSDKKYRKNSAVTCSLDNQDLNIQPPCFDEVSRVYLCSDCDPLANSIISKIMDGFSKKEISELFNITSAKLNSILNKVGRDLYGERYNKKKDL